MLSEFGRVSAHETHWKMIVEPKSEIDLILATKIEFQRCQTNNSLCLKDS